MSAVIPAFLINIRMHAAADLGFGIICFVFQIASLAISPYDMYEQIGIGFWGGLILIITAVVAYKASTAEAPFLLGCSLVLAVFSFMCSFSIMCIFAASIDNMNRHKDDPCTGYVVVPPGNYTGNTSIPIPSCAYYSSARVGMDTILLISGIFGIPINILLALGVINAYNPAPAAGA